MFTNASPVPAMLFGIILGPIAGTLLQTEKWGSAEPGQTEEITLVSLASFIILASDHSTDLELTRV